MSDGSVRELEQRWKRSNDLADGEAYVRAVLRETDFPALPMISMLIQQGRALEAIIEAHISRSDRPRQLVEGVFAALRRPVTPDEMVAFLRGEGDWQRGSQPGLRPPSASTRRCGRIGPTHGSHQDGACVLPLDHSGQHRTAQNSAFCDGHEIYATCQRCSPSADAPPDCNHGPDYTCGRCDPSIDPGDPNALVPRRPVRIGDFALCEHANEVPRVCPCPPGCYCLQNGNTCSDVRRVWGDQDQVCQYCDLDAIWVTNSLPGTYLCGTHLALYRERRAVAMQDSITRGRSRWMRTADDHERCCVHDCARAGVYWRETPPHYFCEDHRNMESENVLCNCGSFNGQLHIPRAGCC